MNMNVISYYRYTCMAAALIMAITLTVTSIGETNPDSNTRTTEIFRLKASPSFLTEEGEVSTSTEKQKPTLYPAADCLMDPELQLWVIDYAKGKGVDPYMIMAICEQESLCEYNLIGDHGESYGIMQVQPQWQQERLEERGWTANDLLDPQKCITIGIEIILEYQAKGYPLEIVLMAYNGGESYALKRTDISTYALQIIDRTKQLRSEGERWEG